MSNGLLGQYHMDSIRRDMASLGVACDGAVVVHHDSRYTNREAVFQICFFGLCPFWKRSAVWRRSTVANREYPVDNHQRHPFGIVCSVKRADTLLHHNRHPFRPAMLQNSKTRPHAVRREYSMKVKKAGGQNRGTVPLLFPCFYHSTDNRQR